MYRCETQSRDGGLLVVSKLRDLYFTAMGFHT